jgi:hypothetical protein
MLTALYVLFVGGFVSVAVLGHILVLNALVFGKAEAKVAKTSTAAMRRTPITS